MICQKICLYYVSNVKHIDILKNDYKRILATVFHIIRYVNWVLIRKILRN